MHIAAVADEYFALALKLNADCIWSKEKRLKEQNEIKVLDTWELCRLLESKRYS